MKKFYLSVEQRERIVNDLLSGKSALEAELEKKSPPLKTIELAESANQERNMLVALFKVEETERY